MEVRVAYARSTSAPLASASKRGRLFTSDDREGTPRVALLSESAARQYFPNEDPIGKTITLGWGKGGPDRAGGQIVGIVGDVKNDGLDEAERLQRSTFRSVNGRSR